MKFYTLQVEYIIVGQGICGSFLSYYLTKKNISHIVIDEAKENSASKVASGVINPITGRRFVRTWMIEEVMPFAVNAYKNFEKEFQCSLIDQTNIIDFHTTPQMKLAFEERLPQETTYLSLLENQNQFDNYFNNPLGAGEIHPCWLIDVNIFLNIYREKLIVNKALIKECFDAEQLKLESEFIFYKDIKAKKIIFCDGVNGANSPWFKLLPYAPNKGEALIVEINDLPRNNIYKTNMSFVPWQDNSFWVGSSYEWKFEHPNPTELFRQKTETCLSQWLKIPFKTIEHLASVRPANIERRPFVGFHPIHNQIGILNGMGTKGCSLAPYFANELVEHLNGNSTINKNVNIKRFDKILSK
ncbi:MAG: NAD(P)/FAD-dependent oxidoreductase [Chitinophagaceae bacterium]